MSRSRCRKPRRGPRECVVGQDQSCLYILYIYNQYALVYRTRQYSQLALYFHPRICSTCAVHSKIFTISFMYIWAILLDNFSYQVLKHQYMAKLCVITGKIFILKFSQKLKRWSVFLEKYVPNASHVKTRIFRARYMDRPFRTVRGYMHYCRCYSSVNARMHISS